MQIVAEQLAILQLLVQVQQYLKEVRHILMMQLLLILQIVLDMEQEQM